VQWPPEEVAARPTKAGNKKVKVVEEGVVGVVGKRPRRKWTTVARRKTIDEGKRKTKRNEDVKKKPDAKKLDAKKSSDKKKKPMSDKDKAKAAKEKKKAKKAAVS
jgi:hypothetical protein